MNNRQTEEIRSLIGPAKEAGPFFSRVHFDCTLEPCFLESGCTFWTGEKNDSFSRKKTWKSKTILFAAQV